MDDELVLTARSGDVPAFDRLARDRIDRLYAIAFRILRDHHDAEDAVQQALWTAWQDLPGLADVSRFDPWLYRVLVHACYRAGRRDRRHGRVLRLVPELDAPRSDDTGTVDDREEIDSAFRSLGPEHRAVVVLHHYVGLPLVEVAEALGIPAGTARSRLHYAHALLRDRIRPDHRSATGGA